MLFDIKIIEGGGGGGEFFQEYHQSVSLDPDQAQHLVGPDLCPNC